MNLLERARRAQADRDNRDEATDDAIYQETDRGHLVRQLAMRATLSLGFVDPPVTAAMLSPVFGEPGRRALYRFEYEGLHFVTGRYRNDDNPIGDSTLLAVQLEQVRGWPQWPPPARIDPRWAPGGYHAVYDLADLADALDQSTISTGEPC